MYSLSKLILVVRNSWCKNTTNIIVLVVNLILLNIWLYDSIYSRVCDGDCSASFGEIRGEACGTVVGTA